MSRPARRPAPWIRCLLVAAALVLAHALMPPGPARSTVYVGGIALAAAVAATGVRRWRPTPSSPWWLLVVALSLSALGSLVWAVLAAEGRDPAAAHAVFLASFAAAVAGVWHLSRAITPRREVAVLLDTAIITTSATVLMWVLVVLPLWQDSTEHGVARVLAAGYPMIGLVLVAIVARLMFGAGLRVPSLWLLAIGLLALVGADTLDAMTVFLATAPAVHPETVRLAALLLAASSAWHPSVAGLARRTPRIQIGPARLAALWSASIAAPAVLLLQGDVDLAVVGLGSITLFSLVVARIWGLLGELRRALRQEHEARFRSLVDNAQAAIAILDAEGRPVYLSPSCRRVFGHPDAELRRGLHLVHPDDRAGLRARVEAAVAAGGGREPIVWQGRIRHADGTYRRVEADLVDHLDDPAIAGIVITAHDITDRYTLQQQLAHQAFHDPLTGLPNRALLADRAERALVQRRDDERRVAVLYLDVDDFKTVNDSLGHAAGDELLRVIAERLRTTVRAGDTVARLGGDEFAVLVPDTDDGDHVTWLAARILEVLQQPVDLDGHRIDPSVSIGIAIRRSDVEVEAFLREADTAMYAAKRRRGGSFQLFDPRMQQVATHRLQVKSELRAAIDRAELTVHYQPIHDLTGGAVAGIEALLRWPHPTRGWVSPADFIPVAEESGAIHELGAFVLERACHEAVAHRRRSGRDVFLSVNLSGRQLLDDRVHTTVRRALDGSGLDPSALLLEVTEGVFLEDNDRVRRAFRELRDTGVRLAIDDFGTGYCSLSYLATFPFDVVKVDRSFVAPLGDADADHRLTLGILDLVASLEVPAVAEGIEDTAQLARLRANGCELGQGFLFGRPAPLAELTALWGAPVPGFTARAAAVPAGGSRSVPA